jgi:ubiquinone/menaquinone biosynthesis C-methylase UbiE
MREVDEDFEIDRPDNAGRLYNFLIDYKFKKVREVLPFYLKNLSVLDICCGSGMISEYYAKEGAEVTGVDISFEAIARAKMRAAKHGFLAHFHTGDSEKLPFPDGSFDIVSVHDGLHHLRKPEKAVREMVRVANKGIVIIEPAKSLITKISVKLGISTDYEGKDFVFRFRETEMRKWLREFGVKENITKRYIMYYPHKPGRIFQVSGIPVLFQLVKMVFYLLNVFFSRCGNKIQVIGLK